MTLSEWTPSEEEIALFVEGKLEGAERDRLFEYLQTHPELQEVISNASAAYAELRGDQEAAPMERPEPIIRPAAELPKRGRSFMLLAAGLALFALALAFLWVQRSARTASPFDQLALLEESGETLHARLGDDWRYSVWTEMRGGGDATELDPGRRLIQKYSFRLGVRTIDLATSLRAENLEDAVYFTDRVLDELRELPNATAPRVAFEQLREELYAAYEGGTQPTRADEYSSSLELASDLAARAVELNAFEAGQRLNLVRVLAAAGGAGEWKAPLAQLLGQGVLSAQVQERLQRIEASATAEQAHAEARELIRLLGDGDVVWPPAAQ